MSDFHLQRLETEAQGEAYAEILATSFGGGLEETSLWMKDHPANCVRLVVEGERVLGGLILIRMGQFFGGRSVPMVGIAAVGVDPADRATGAGTFLMRETVRELHEEGVALSSLFPATQPLYRRAGYEQAGTHFRVRVATARLTTDDRSLPLRRAAEADQPAIERLHRAAGAENPGNVDRDDVMWKHIRTSSKERIHTYVVEGDSGLEGYVYYIGRRNKFGHQTLFVTDMVARTAGAARRLLTFFRHHHTLVDHIQWRGHPADPLLLQAREQRHEVKLWDTWMLRVVDVPKALEARGYPAGITTEVHLDLTDDLCEQNAGRWTVRVEDGQAQVSRGGDGRVRMDVRVLAPLYSGFASPQQLRSACDLACSDEDAQRLALLFAGPAPWMQDGF